MSGAEAHGRPAVVFGGMPGQLEFSEAFTPATEREVAALFDDLNAERDAGSAG